MRSLNEMFSMEEVDLMAAYERLSMFRRLNG